MYKVSEEDRKIFLEFLSRKPYIEEARLIGRIATWEIIQTKEKNGKDKVQ